MATVRELVTKLGFQVQEAPLKKYEKSTERAKQGANEAAASFRNMFTAFAGTERAKQGANEAAASFRNMFMAFASLAAIRSISRTADGMQSLEARIGMLPQTVGDVGSAFNEVAKNATANRQSIEAYGSFYTKLGNASKGVITNQEDLLKVTNTVSQALVVGGANTMEAQSAMLQFAQALGSGVLQGDEFRSISEAAPQYLDELSKAMNIPRENLKKMASEGKLTAKAVIEATMKMSSTFEEKFKKMPMTVGQATIIMGNKWATFIGNFNRETMVVTKVANFMVNAMDKVSNALDSFVKAVGGGENALKVLGITLAAILGPMALGGLLTILGVLFSPAALFFGIIVLLGLAIDDLIGYLNGADSVTGDFLEWLNSGTVAAYSLIGAVGALAAVILYKLGASLLAASAQFITSIALSSALNGGIVGLIANFGLLAVSALAAGAKMAVAWLLALGPIGLVLAAIAAVTAAVVYLYKNWEKVKGFFVTLVGGTATPSAGAQTMASAASQAMQSNTQTINVTVPPGSPAATQEAARNGVAAALGESPGFFAGQIGQAL